MRKRNSLLGLVTLLPLLCSCKKDGDRQFGIFTVLENKVTVEMEGEIGNQTLNDFEAMISEYPEIGRIEIIECPGSGNDDVNLEVSALVYARGISTHIKDGGEVASGGTDFFLAGVKRTVGTDTRIGVHSWEGGGQEATDFPVGHQEHQKYIDYYVSVGFSQELAEDFYYFTINAASSDNMHYMTAGEISQYGIIR